MREPHSGQSFRHDEGSLRSGPQRFDDLNHLGNDVARPLHHDRIADPDILPVDLVLIMQGRPADHDAADTDRPHDGDRREDPCPPHLDDDRFDDRLFSDSGEFAGDRPAGAAGNETEALLQSKVVHLDHHPVDLIGEPVPDLADVLIIANALFYVGGRLDQFIDREAPGGKRPEDLALRPKGGPLRRADRIAEHREGPFCRHPRVELAERSRRRVPGIGEGRLSLRFATVVQVAEGLPLHAHLPPDLDPFRNDRHGDPAGCIFIPAGDDKGNRGYRSEVQRDILADGPIPPRGSDHESGHVRKRG